MKKLISLILCCLICGITSAQLIKQKVEKQKKQSELDWYNCSFDRDSVYGAEVNKAYEYLNANKKKLKKRPIVALIGTGMDVEHEDLRQAIWINPKEKLNQKMMIEMVSLMILMVGTSSGAKMLKLWSL